MVPRVKRVYEDAGSDDVEPILALTLRASPAPPGGLVEAGAKPLSGAR